MRPKGGKAARPRFHCYFQIDPVTDADEYSAMKRHALELFRAFDANAVDAARFLFGV
ncbi:MAG: hypothetical protein LBS11_04265 [Oscillospiraceae bacterium]|jgi:hypothetical protein|nr:hypothetical protein [Oscillospiraceae bacterium]